MHAVARSVFTVACATLLIPGGTFAQASDAATPLAAPTKLAFLIFPAFEPLDVFGPLEVFQALSRSQHLDLYIISSSSNATLELVTTAPSSPSMNRYNSTVFVTIMPTHTLAAPPDDVEMIFVPGGLGTRAPDPALSGVINYINATYPSLHSLIAPCTGAGIVARAGVLDGRRATSNKHSWASVTALRPQVNWDPYPRWVQDGNIWTSGGVSAATDVALAWVADTWGEEVARNTSNQIEYEWHNDKNWDPFAYVWVY